MSIFVGFSVNNQNVSMWVLFLLLIIGAISLMLLTFLNRKNKNEEIEVNFEIDEGCCGAHEICEKDSLLNFNTEIIYFDDEELDDLSNTPSEEYTDSQKNMLSEVFYTLQESDVAPWLRSLQLRNIQLPADIKEEALLIISERRVANQ